MPKLVRLYIRQVAVGFALSGGFVALLLWFDVAGLGHLVAGSDVGAIAVAMLFVFNGLVFSGVQFAIRVMAMAAREDASGGPAEPLPLPVPVPVRAR